MAGPVTGDGLADRSLVQSLEPALTMPNWTIWALLMHRAQWTAPARNRRGAAAHLGVRHAVPLCGRHRVRASDLSSLGARVAAWRLGADAGPAIYPQRPS
jgi:hypothetical protein